MYSNGHMFFEAYVVATTQRGDRLSERCAIAVTSPFGVTGHLLVYQHQRLHHEIYEYVK